GRVLCVGGRGRGALVAADGEALSGGRRIPRDQRERGSRSRDDRPLPRPTRAGVGGDVRAGACAVREGWLGVGRRGRARRQLAGGERLPGGKPPLRLPLPRGGPGPFRGGARRVLLRGGPPVGPPPPPPPPA